MAIHVQNGSVFEPKKQQKCRVSLLPRVDFSSRDVYLRRMIGREFCFPKQQNGRQAEDADRRMEIEKPSLLNYLSCFQCNEVKS